MQRGLNFISTVLSIASNGLVSTRMQNLVTLESFGLDAERESAWSGEPPCTEAHTRPLQKSHDTTVLSCTSKYFVVGVIHCFHLCSKFVVHYCRCVGVARGIRTRGVLGIKIHRSRPPLVFASDRFAHSCSLNLSPFFSRPFIDVNHLSCVSSLHTYTFAVCTCFSYTACQSYALVLTTPALCGQLRYSTESNDYGETLFMCFGGGGGCYTPEGAMKGFCE